MILCPLSLDAAIKDSAISSVEVGVNGFFKLGKWVPVTVKIDPANIEVDQASPIQLKLSATDSNGNRAIFIGESKTVTGSDELALKGWFQSGRLEDVLNIIIEEKDSGKVLDTLYQPLSKSREKAQTLINPLRQSAYVIAGIGAPSGFSSMGEPDKKKSRVKSDNLNNTRFIALDDLKTLPSSSKGLEGLDAIVIAGEYDVSEELDKVIKQWVKSGGHLILAVGKKYQQFQKSKISEWIPFTVKEVAPLRELTELEIFSGKRRPISFNRQVSAARFEPADGAKVLVESRNGALIAQSLYGFGKVTLIGLDIHKAPFLKWRPMKDVAYKVLFGSRKKTEETKVVGKQLSHLGVNDLATQIRNYMEEFKEVKRLSNWSVMGIVLIYLMIIGPLDYLIVHKILKKPHWTWVTFPLLVAVASVISIKNAQTLNGDQLQVHSMDIFDLDVSSKFSRTLSYIDIYSPETRRYKIESVPANPIINSDTKQKTSSSLIWSGPPEEGVGGIYRMAGVDAGHPSYKLGENYKQISNLPIQIWSTANLQASQTEDGIDLLENHLKASPFNRLKGTIKHSFPGPIKDWMIFHQDNIYFPDPELKDESLMQIKPGVSFSLAHQGINQENLKRYMTGTIIVVKKSNSQIGNDYRAQQTVYDVLSKEPFDILKAISFYKKVGGETYYHLRNDVLRTLDFSDSLDHNQAILLGRVDQPATEVKLNDKLKEASRHDSFVRIVFPVEIIKPEKKPEKKPEEKTEKK